MFFSSLVEKGIRARNIYVKLMGDYVIFSGPQSKSCGQHAGFSIGDAYVAGRA